MSSNGYNRSGPISNGFRDDDNDPFGLNEEDEEEQDLERAAEINEEFLDIFKVFWSLKPRLYVIFYANELLEFFKNQI